MRAGRVLAVALLLSVPLLGGCSSPLEGDCNLRLALDGVVYRPHSELRQDAPRGRLVGRAEQRDCDGSALPGAPTQRVWSVEGVDPAVAISTGPARRPAVYVPEGSTPEDWPEVLRRR